MRFMGLVGGAANERRDRALHVYKFRPTSLESNQGDVDVPLQRYAETLLTYAEAQNELNNTVTAIQYVNMVRERARGG